MNYHREPPPPLFQQPKPPTNGTDTSAQAAAAIEPASAKLRAVVYEAIRAAPNGLTDEEGQRVTGLRNNTYVPRRWELDGMGLLTRTAMRRKTESGRSAAVWVVKNLPQSENPA